MNRRSDTRERILDAAQSLIQRQGVNGMSFQDISDIVGIRKPSIHHHFASKDELVETLLSRYRQQFETTLDAILTADGDAQSRLVRYMAVFEQTLNSGDEDLSCLCGMLAAEVFSLSETAAESVSGFLCDNARFLQQLLTEGRHDGSLSFDGEPEAAASMILATLQGGLLVARSCNGPAQLSAIIAQLQQTFCRAR